MDSSIACSQHKCVELPIWPMFPDYLFLVTMFYVIDKLKTGDLLSKNTNEKLQILQIKDKNINAITSKNPGMVGNVTQGYKDTF